MKNNKIIKEGFWSLFGQSFSALFTILGIRIITEYVTPEHYGQYVVFAGINLLFVNVISGSIFQSFLRIIPENGTKSYDKAILLSSIIVSFFGSIAFCSLVISILLKSHFIFLVFIFLLFLISEHFIGLFQVLLNIKKKQKRYAFFQIFMSITKPLFAVILYTYYESNFISILLGYAFGNLLTAFLFNPNALIKSFIPSFYRQSYLGNFSEFTTFAKPLVFQKMLGWSLRNADRLIIAFFLGTSTAGQYAPIVSLVSMLYNMASRSIEIVFRPYYFEYVASKKIKRSKKILRIYFLSLLIVSICFITFFSLFSKQIVFLILGGNFREYYYLMPLLSLGSSLLMFGYFFENICYGYKRTWNIFFIETMAAITNIIMLPIMIYNFGVKGVPLALLCTYLVHCISGFILTRKLLKE